MEMLFILDISIFLLLIVLANLSKRIGEAMMIPPFYQILYYLAVLVAGASITDVVVKGMQDLDYIHTITLSARSIAAIVSIPVCYRYWKWLFNENLKR